MDVSVAVTSSKSVGTVADEDDDITKDVIIAEHLRTLYLECYR